MANAWTARSDPMFPILSAGREARQRAPRLILAEGLKRGLECGEREAGATRYVFVALPTHRATRGPPSPSRGGRGVARPERRQHSRSIAAASVGRSLPTRVALRAPECMLHGEGGPCEACGWGAAADSEQAGRHRYRRGDLVALMNSAHLAKAPSPDAARRPSGRRPRAEPLPQGRVSIHCQFIDSLAFGRRTQSCLREDRARQGDDGRDLRIAAPAPADRSVRRLGRLSQRQTHDQNPLMLSPGLPAGEGLTLESRR